MVQYFLKNTQKMKVRVRAYGSKIPLQRTPFYVDSSTGNIGIGKPATSGHAMDVSGIVRASQVVLKDSSAATDISDTMTAQKHVSVLMNSYGYSWSTFLTGDNNATFYGVALDASTNNLFCAGAHGNPRHGRLVKYNASGVLLWSVAYDNAPHTSAAYGVAVDSEGNAVTVGEYDGTSPLTVYDGSNTEQVQCSAQRAGNILFITKHGPTGDVIWVRTVDTRASSNVSYPLWRPRVAVDASGRILVTYSWQPDAPGAPVLMSASGDTLHTWPDVAVPRAVNTLAMSSSGDFLWATTMSNPLALPTGLAVDMNDNSVYVSCARSTHVVDVYDTYGTLIAQMSEMNAAGSVVTKFSASGTCMWRITTETNPEYGWWSGNVCVDSSSYVYSTAIYKTSASILDSSDIAHITLIHPGSQSTFLAKHTPTGTPLWAATMKNVTWQVALRTNTFNDVILTGYHGNTAIISDASRTIHHVNADGKTYERGYCYIFSASGTLRSTYTLPGQSTLATSVWDVTSRSSADGRRQIIYLCGRTDDGVFVDPAGARVGFDGSGVFLASFWELCDLALVAVPVATGAEKIVVNKNRLHAVTMRLTNASNVAVETVTVPAGQARRFVWAGSRWHKTT